MGIKKYNPYTPSRRHMTGSDFAEITKATPEKSLVVSLKKNAGRNNQGKITVRHHGGGSRRKYRIIDFKRNRKDGIPATVVAIEYDPNRTANIALICYADGEKAYILAPAGLTVGMKVMSGETAEAKVGNCLPLAQIPVGTEIHNIELYPGKGGQLARSAGCSAMKFAADSLIHILAASPVKRKKIQAAQAYDGINHPGQPAGPKEKCHQIKTEKTDQPPVYGTNNSDGQGCGIKRLVHKRKPPFPN